MRFMVLVPGSPESEAGEMPSTEMLGAMTKYNEELVKAGVMLAGEGLHPTLQGRARPLRRRRAHRHRRPVHRGQGARRAATGSGECESREEAIEWLKRAPFDGRRRDRAAPGLRGRGLRRGADAGAARGQTSGCASRPPQTRRRVTSVGHPSRDRRGLADRVGPADRRAGAHRARRRRWPRSSPRTRSSPRSSSGRSRASRTTRAPG